MKTLVAFCLFFSFSFGCLGQTNQTTTDTAKLSELFIKKLTPIHCAKGIDKCEKCKETAAQGEKYFLIRVYYVTSGTVTRPVTEVNLNGKKTFYEYDIENAFDTQEAAMVYSRQKGVKVLPNN